MCLLDLGSPHPKKTKLHTVFLSGPFPSGFLTKTLYVFRFSACMLHSLLISYTSTDHSNFSWRRVQVTKLLITLFSPASYYFIPLRSSAPRFHTSSVYDRTLMSDQVSHPYRTAGKNHNFVYSNFYVFRRKTRIQNILN
jgi:hypothetical protein